MIIKTESERLLEKAVGTLRALRELCEKNSRSGRAVRQFPIYKTAFALENEISFAINDLLKPGTHFDSTFQASLMPKSVPVSVTVTVHGGNGKPDAAVLNRRRRMVTKAANAQPKRLEMSNHR